MGSSESHQLFLVPGDGGVVLEEPVVGLVLALGLLPVEAVLPAAEFLLEMELIHGLVGGLILLNFLNFELVVCLLHLQLLRESETACTVCFAHRYSYYQVKN